MSRYLGVDIGSLFLSAVVTDGEGHVQQSCYERHQGELLGACRRLLQELDLTDVAAVAVTGIGGDRVEGLGTYVDPMVALVEGIQTTTPDVRNILYVGAGSYSLVRLSESGQYLGHTTNTACASGTGAFLDQQALRLGFTPEELADKAEEADRSPSVATRCAVFAKTDMIHLQQEGYSPTEIAAGLCESLGHALVQMLLKGRTLRGETVLCGGVARNRRVREALESTLGFSVHTPDRPELAAATGAAVMASRAAEPVPFVFEELAAVEVSHADSHGQPPLELRHSTYPEFTWHDFQIDDNGTEITLPKPLEKGKTYQVTMGIDIGSTSTKALLMDQDREVIALNYRATAGDPIRATQHVLNSFTEMARREGVTLDILAAGTTGSGRKMIKAVVGAELEKDEITAHAKAATFLDPKVDTILEIGGQDSKFTQLEDGVVVNSVMNYVCAAGTGSFIEEQAKNLGVSVWDYADFVMGSTAPRTSDRCTVFMERDLKERLAEGCTRKEAATAVLYSVRDNYMNKVVQGLQIGERVYFQGATARNKGLIAAFERALEKPILVSEFCHVTGAMGIALMLLESPPETKTFRGLEFGQSDVETSSEVCELCANKCNLTLIHTPEGTVAWGLKCGRDYDEKKPKKQDRSRFGVFESRKKRLFAGGGKPGAPAFRVAVPRALTTWGYLPLWRNFFQGLGAEIVLSPPSSDKIMEQGRSQMTAEFCAPIVMGLGHMKHLIEQGVDYLFAPTMVRETKTDNVTDAQFCCFIQGFPAVVKSTEAARSAKKQPRFISPVIEFGLTLKKFAKNMDKGLKEAGINLPFAKIQSALKAGLEAQRLFDDTTRAEGAEALTKLSTNNEMGVVIMGRPYNANDPGLNLDLPRKISQMGVTPLPMDALPAKPADLSDEWENMYWNYGQRILSAAEYIAKSDNLFGVLFTNFACGPDSYLVTFFKTIMGRAHKPYLILQFDGHGADAGYMTRVEAAIESFRAWTKRNVDPRPKRVSGEVDKDRTILFPPMDPYSVHLLAACFKGHGYKTEVMEENATTLSQGYAHCQGGECVPCPSTLGSAINYMETSGKKPSEVAFFMPTASGPCRFGQYQRLAEIVFDRKGWHDLLVVSPSGVNAYQGLSQALRRQAWVSIVIGDILQKVLFKLRPYEQRVGEVERTLWQTIHAVCGDLAARRDPAASLRVGIESFQKIPLRQEKRPKIGIVGEIYLRSNHFLNEDIARMIERLGGEVLKAGLAEWFFYTAYLVKKVTRGGKTNLFDKLGGYVNNWFFTSHEHKYFKIADPILFDRHEPDIAEVVERGLEYVPVEFEGESVLTLGRAELFFERDGCDAVVNTSPTFCMPGTITTSLFARIEEEIGKPVICLFYDGSGNPNQELVPHMHFLRERFGLPGQAPKPSRAATRA